MRKKWEPLDQVVLSEPAHNPDVIEAVHTVRGVLQRRSLPHLDTNSVLVDARPKLRAAHFRFEHREKPDVIVEIRQGDGYTAWRSPTGKYDGYIRDEDFPRFVEAKLVESFGPDSL
jgi:hypothetical protein